MQIALPWEGLHLSLFSQVHLIWIPLADYFLGVYFIERVGGKRE